MEPLESTSIHLIQRAVIRLMQMFPYDGVRQPDVDEFNNQMKFEIDNVRDFIILHYHVDQSARHKVLAALQLYAYLNLCSIASDLFRKPAVYSKSLPSCLEKILGFR